MRASALPLHDTGLDAGTLNLVYTCSLSVAQQVLYQNCIIGTTLTCTNVVCTHTNPGTHTFTWNERAHRSAALACGGRHSEWRSLSAHIISEFVLIKLMKGDEDGQAFCCFLIEFEGCCNGGACECVSA